MFVRKKIKYRGELIIAVPLLAAAMISCSSRSGPSHEVPEFCQLSGVNMDSLLFERDAANDSLLFEQIKNCDDVPRMVELKLDLLIDLERFGDGLQYVSTLSRENFNNTYDSLIYRTFFASKLEDDQAIKIKMFKNVVRELEKYLASTPLDTLALGNYCLYLHEYETSEYVFEKIDSMAFANHYDPVYRFIMSVYFPDQYRQYTKKRLFNK